MTLRPLVSPPCVGDEVLLLLGGGNRNATRARVVEVTLAGTGDPADDRVVLAPIVDDGTTRTQISRSWLTLFQQED